MNLKHIRILFLFLVFNHLTPLASFSQKKTFYWTDTTIEDGAKYTSRSIRYKLGKAELLDTNFVHLDSIVQFMKVNKKIGLVINGHSDTRSNPAIGLRLSSNRAIAIRDYLIAKGIGRERLRTKGWEGLKPIISDTQIQKTKNKGEREALHALNRRIEYEVFIMRDTFLIRGEIIDRKKREEKIPFAEISVYKNDSFITKITSDVFGDFSCKLTSYNSYNFIVKYLGCVTDTALFFIDYNNANYNLVIGLDCNPIICTEVLDRLEYENNISAALAKQEIEKGKPKIFVYCGLAYTEEVGQEIFEYTYGINYIIYGCIEPPADRMKEYNEVVFSYLDTKYGRGWRKKIRKNVVGLK